MLNSIKSAPLLKLFLTIVSILFFFTTSFGENKVYQQQLSTLYTTDNPNKKFEALVYIIDSWNKGQNDSCMKYSRLLYSLANETRNENHLIKAYLEMGISHHYYSNTDSAEYFLLKSEALINQYAEASVKDKFDTYINLTSIYNIKSKYILSTAYIIKAIKLAEAEKNNKWIKAAKVQYAQNLVGSGNLRDAANYYLEAISVESEDLISDIKNMIYLADVYLELRKPDSTVYYATIARQLSKEGEIMYYYSGISIAAGLSDLHQYDKAINILNKDEPGGNKMNDIQYAGYSSFLRGTSYLKLKKYPQALVQLERALNYATQSKNVILEIQVSKDLERFYTENNQYELAYKYSKKAYQLSDSIHTLDNEKQISNLNSNFKLEKKQEELKKKQEELIQHRNLLWASAAAITVFIILSILLYRSDQKRKKLNIELAELNNKKDRLFRVMSHDLRSPLADLYHQIDIEQKKLPEDYDKSGLNTIQQRLSGTLNMLDNLLYWSIGQIQGLKYTPKPFYISHAFEDALSINKHAILARQLMVINEVNEDLMAYGDQQMITTVLRNLIQNAIKFSHEHGTLRLKTTEVNSETLQCSVKDDGIGMSKLEIDNAFDGGSSKPGTKGEKGTGVGLNLCKTFIEINKGRIYIESEQNAGTTLFIEIPIAN